ncbi:LysR family transcriptional regulator [Phaeobacter sp.]|uniref:LysR family transcriptional regulator n=1 Tax=Phaeobacter sp. TaxID=1902409 RepID=UPI0025CC36D3|nr:LysR family transcriptional regulator [Phaeobacter sp.]
MPRFTLRQLEYFVAVGETGSISRASQKLSVSSPSISSAITQLESHFGIPLFVRQHAQGLALTSGGRRVLEQAHRVLAEAHVLTDIASDVSTTARGALTIGCFVTFAQLVLPRLRREFVADFPEIQVNQCEMDQAALFDALRRSDIDVALTYDMDIPADLQFSGLVRLRPFALFDPQHPLADRETVSLPELADWPMVLMDLPISTEYFLSLFDAHGVRPNIAERTRDMAVMRSMVGNGFGYSIATVRPRSDMSPDGQMIRSVPISGDVRSLRMGLLTAQNADQSRNIRAFIEFGKAQVQKGAFAAIGGEALR